MGSGNRRNGIDQHRYKTVTQAVRRAVARSAVLLLSGLIAHSARADEGPVDRADYVQIRNGRFELHGQRFVLRGVNYFGSWRFDHLFSAGDHVEYFTIWALFHNWNAESAARDFAFLRSTLRATAVRIPLPTRDAFASLVQYHDYAPWYQADGSISDTYKKVLTELADTAYAGGIRIQFCLLWNIKNEIAASPDLFAPGAELDRFYANQVRSVGAALRDHPGVMAYSIGNEALVKWGVNGTGRSSYEGRAAAFIARRLKDLREVAPAQLLTEDEIAAPGGPAWLSPGPELAVVADRVAGVEGQPFRLVDAVDYLGPHFYSEVLKPADLPDGAFQPKLVDAAQRIAQYMSAVKPIGKPVVINEFGLKTEPIVMAPADYAKPHDAFYQAIATAAQQNGLQGLLSWGGLPALRLRAGDFTVAESHLNPSSSTETDIRSSAERVLFFDPSWDLYVWDTDGDEPHPTAAARILAATWPRVPLPRLPNKR